MQAKLKTPLRVLLTIAMAAVPIMPVAAQMSSKAGQISIVAIMPETLKLSFDTNESGQLAVAIDTSGSPLVATAVKTAWWLAPGRAQVITSAYIKHPAAPVLIALSARSTTGPSAQSALAGSRPYEFRIPQPVSTISISRIDSTIMESNRVDASTTSLATSNDPVKNLSSDTFPGTLTIQVQPVL